MDFVPYSDYFEQLASKSKAIAHNAPRPRFCRFNIEEVLGALRHDVDITEFCLFLESFEGSLSENDSDQVFDNQDGAFLILKACPSEDFAAQNQILDDSKRIALQFVARIRKDARAGVSLFQKLDLNSIEYHKVGPVFDNCYGHRVSFSNEEAISLVVKKDDWTDL